MANTLEGALAGVPGLGGFLGAQQFNTQQEGAQLQQASGVMRLADALRGQQEERQLREIVSQGGSPEAVIGALLKTGPKGAEAAHKYAQALSEMSKNAAFGAASGNPSSDKLRALSIYHPHLGDLADRMDKRTADVAQMGSIQSQSMPITETPTMDAGGAMRSVIPQDAAPGQLPPEVVAAQASGKPFSIGVGDVGEKVPVGGLFTPFLESQIPEIRNRAKMLQAQANQANPLSQPPGVWEKRADELGRMEAQFMQQKGLQQTRGEQALERVQQRPVAQQKAPAGYQFKEDGTLEPIKGGPRDLGATDVKALEMDAMRYLADGTMPPNMGRGVQGAAEAKAIRNRAQELADELGMKPDEIRANQAVMKSTSSALQAIQRQKALVLAYEKTALKGADIALEMSDKVSRDTSVPVLDKWIQAGRKGIAGDVDVTRLQNAVETLTNEYAKVMSGSSGGQATTVSMQQHAREMLNAAMTKDQFKGVVDLMKREMRETREPAFDAQIDELKASMVNSLRKPGEAPAAPTAASAPAAAPVPPAAIEMLKKFPNTRAQFDAKYGAGRAASVLGN